MVVSAILGVKSDLPSKLFPGVAKTIVLSIQSASAISVHRCETQSATLMLVAIAHLHLAITYPPADRIVLP